MYPEMKRGLSMTALFKHGRGEMIRTSDPLVPNQMRYQAALRPEDQNNTGTRRSGQWLIDIYNAERNYFLFTAFPNQTLFKPPLWKQSGAPFLLPHAPPWLRP
jgi:hypothetical protein